MCCSFKQPSPFHSAFAICHVNSYQHSVHVKWLKGTELSGWVKLLLPYLLMYLDPICYECMLFNPQGELWLRQSQLARFAFERSEICAEEDGTSPDNIAVRLVHINSSLFH